MEDRVAFFDNIERLVQLGGYVFISSAIKRSIDEKAPLISPIKRSFVHSESIVEALKVRGFELLEEWYTHGIHEHFYGLFRKIER